MDSLIELRESKRKPASINLELIVRHDDLVGLSSITGMVNIQIGPDEVLSELDLRPIVGCDVAVYDFADDPERHLALFDLAAAAKPSKVWTTFSDGESFTLHVRKPPRYCTEEAKLCT